MDSLPPYFKEYMEQKFNELHLKIDNSNSKIDNSMKQHDTEFNDIRSELQEVKKETKWNSQKIWMAMGALTVISLVGGTFAMYFKELNKNQINEAVRSALATYDVKVDY